jgi:hypothetical protein
MKSLMLGQVTLKQSYLWSFHPKQLSYLNDLKGYNTSYKDNTIIHRRTSRRIQGNDLSTQIETQD